LYFRIKHKTASSKQVLAHMKALFTPVTGALFLLLVTGADQVQAEDISAKIIHVDDGDTVVALTPSRERIKVRLASIDAPETGHGNCRPGQPYSSQSKQRLSSLVSGKALTMRCYEPDFYGRAVCDLPVNGTTASRILVAEGLAWANRGGQGYIRDAGITTDESTARAAKLGLWRESSATPPWVWRKTEWMTAQPGCRRAGDR
jgi:endonuclease YncB( thermonuclease family)